MSSIGTEWLKQKKKHIFTSLFSSFSTIDKLKIFHDSNERNFLLYIPSHVCDLYHSVEFAVAPEKASLVRRKCTEATRKKSFQIDATVKVLEKELLISFSECWAMARSVNLQWLCSLSNTRHCAYSIKLFLKKDWLSAEVVKLQAGSYLIEYWNSFSFDLSENGAVLYSELWLLHSGI